MQSSVLRRICVLGICMLGMSSFAGDASAQFTIAPVLPSVSYSSTAQFGTRNCTPTQRTEIQRAANESKRLLIAGGTAPQFFRWFGLLDLTQQTQDLKNAVQYVRIYALQSLTLLGGAAASAPNVVFDCSGHSVQFPAHVTGAGTGVVFLSAPFWMLPLTPTSGWHDSRAGTIIHELSHLAGTGDFHRQFGYTNPFVFAFDLARLWPSATFWNADNHEYFYVGE